MIPQHLAGSGETYTPPWLVEAAREALGGIDLDVASSASANSIINAECFHTHTWGDVEYGKWWGRVFCNPPGACPFLDGKHSVCGNAKRCSCKLVRRFWERLSREVISGNVDSAIWIGFQLGQLQSLGDLRTTPLSFPTCILRERVRYLDVNLEPRCQPPHGSYVTCVSRDHKTVERFVGAFRAHGVIVMRTEGM